MEMYKQPTYLKNLPGNCGVRESPCFDLSVTQARPLKLKLLSFAPMGRVTGRVDCNDFWVISASKTRNCCFTLTLAVQLLPCMGWRKALALLGNPFFRHVVSIRRRSFGNWRRTLLSTYLPIFAASQKSWNVFEVLVFLPSDLHCVDLTAHEGLGWGLAPNFVPLLSSSSDVRPRGYTVSWFLFSHFKPLTFSHLVWLKCWN